MRGGADLIKLADGISFSEACKHRMLPLQYVDHRSEVSSCLIHVGKTVAHAHERRDRAQQCHGKIRHALLAPLLHAREQAADLIVEQAAGVVLFEERERAFPVLHVEQHVRHVEPERHFADLRVAVL